MNDHPLPAAPIRRRPRSPLCLALAVLPLAAAPYRAWSEGFPDVKGRAEQVESLSGFLERFIGDCKDPFQAAACQANVKVARKALQGKLLFASVGERAALDILKGEADGDRFRVLMTPFVDAGSGYALTHGAPRKQDPQGRPLMDLLVLEGRLPEGMGALDFGSAFRAGNVGIELVFKPEGTWKLKRKAEAGFYEGVKARFVAVRLFHLRTGTEIATKVL